MNKKVLLIISFIISCFIFAGCGKDSKSSNALIGSTVTLRNEFGPDKVEVTVVESDRTIEIPNNERVVVKSFDEEFMEITAERNLNGKKQLISVGLIDHVYFDFDTMLKATADAALAQEYTRLIFAKPVLPLSQEQAVTLYENFISKLPDNFLQTYSIEDEKSRFYAGIITTLFFITDQDQPAEKVNKTTVFHLLAEKANEAFASNNLGAVYNNRYYFKIQDEEGRTPLMRAILKENYEACKAFYFLPQALSDVKDKNGKNFVDYARESSNQQIKNLFSVSDVTEEELVKDHLPLLMKLQFAENFNAIDFRTYEVSYTLFNRAVSKNIYINANSKESYKTELALQEGMLLLSDESDSESKDDEETETPSLNFPSDVAFVFSRSEDGSIDHATKLKLRAAPSKDAKETGILEYGAKVTILERSENTDIIEDISDYWYKVKSDKNEGWCFGGFLFAAVQNNNYKKNEETRYDTWITQDAFKKNSFAYVGIDSSIIGKDGKETAVKSGSKVEILAAVPYKNDINKDTKLEFYAFDPNLTWFDHSEHYIQYPYYIVRDGDNNIGVMSGFNLAHVCHTDSYVDENTVFYFSFAHNNADVFEYDSKTKKSRRYTFAKSEGIAAKPTLLNLGWDLHKDMNDYPTTYVKDIFNFEDYIGPGEGSKKKLKLIVFVSEGYEEMGEGTVFHYNVFTVTDHFAILSHEFIGSGWSNEYGFNYSSLKIDFTDEGKLTAEEINTGRSTYYDETRDHSHYAYYEWDNTSLTFIKTGEKDTDYIDER